MLKKPLDRKMMQKLKVFFTPPVFEDRAKTVMARNSFFLAIVGLTTPIILTIVFIIFASENIFRILLIALAVPVALLEIILLHKGFVRPTILIQTGIIWLTIVVTAAFTGGIRAIGFTGGTMAALLIMGIAWEWQTTIVLTVASILTAIAFSWGEHLGWIDPTLAFESPILMVSVYSTFLVVLSGLLYLTYQSITTSLAQAEQEIKERQQAEAMVRTLNEELEEPIAKRTEELAQEIKERKQAQADLAALARTDSLTGLFSRHNFFELAEKEFSESIRYQRPLSLIMLDLDFFKGINDTYGHIVGDCVLTHIGKLLRQTIRESDTAARYGGEEFIMLLPETDSISAELFADRLREIAADSPVQCESDRIHITISIGVAGKNSDDKVATLNKLISKTDQALYQAKRAGKNLVVVYSE